MADQGATFKQKTVMSILQQFFKDDKIKINSTAVALVTEVLRILIAEAVHRSGTQAKKEGMDTVAIDHLEKILPQLLLDM